MAEPLQTAALSLYILSFNCARSLINVDLVASQIFSALESSTLPDLVVLSLQEIAPVSHALIGNSFLFPYLDRFKQAVQSGARRISTTTENAYTPIAVRNLGMTGLMVFAKDPSAIQDVEVGGVGVGIWDIGTKGAVGIRLKYVAEGSSTELTFVGAHLDAMEDAVQKRNNNWKDIVRGLVFSSDASESRETGEDERPLLSISSHDASIYKSTSHLFVAGDLNYRTSILPPSPDDVINAFPQPHDEPSSPRHYSELFKSDQLNQERSAGRTLHGLKEAPVTFPPTYKFDSNGPFLKPDDELSKWDWAEHRWPSWCDRILYLDVPSWIQESYPKSHITPHRYTALPLFPSSDHRPVALEFTVPIIPIPHPDEDEEGDDPRINPPFQIDVNWRARRDRARMAEIVVGSGTYFATTKEGAAIATAIIAGIVGASFALHAIL